MRFRVQNAPYPTLHECFFAKHRVDWKESYHIMYLKTPFFPISANLEVFCRSVTRQKPVLGRLGQVLYAKSHRNRMKSRMCTNGPLRAWAVQTGNHDLVSVEIGFCQTTSKALCTRLTGTHLAVSDPRSAASPGGDWDGLQRQIPRRRPEAVRAIRVAG